MKKIIILIMGYVISFYIGYFIGDNKLPIYVTHKIYIEPEIKYDETSKLFYYINGSKITFLRRK